MANRTRYHNDETALSEVIGFILILGLLTVVFALYLTYGIPVQGRENEILHMNDVKDEMVGYKLSLDSLFTNSETDTTLSNSFNLGTSGVYSQGFMSIIPIMSPVSSAGIIALNQRNATLNISSQSLILNPNAFTSVDLKSSQTSFNYTPDHVYVNITIPSSVTLNATGNYGLTVTSSQWSATLNLTPQTTFYQWYSLVNTQASSQQTACATGANNNGTAIPVYESSSIWGCLVPINAYAFNGTDLTVSIKKNNLATMQNYPVYHSVVNSGKTYTIDLMDDIYGLNLATNPGDTVTLVVDRPLSGVIGNGNISYDFTEKTFVYPPIVLGSVEYKSENNYWINQNYYYQDGGVFLSQIDGNTTYKLPPKINFYNEYSPVDPSRNIVVVNIDALHIDPNNGGVVGGNSPVQIQSTMTQKTVLPYASASVGSGNTKWIRIGVSTPDDQARGLWTNYFYYTASVNGIASFSTGTTGNETYINITGSPALPYGIRVNAADATFSNSIHGIGGSTS